jgi:quinol monooxygenase YgiN
MALIVICAFRPRKGKEQDLLGVIRDHMPTLRSQNLITDRTSIVGRAADGTIIEVFEWKNQAAVEYPRVVRAHRSEPDHRRAQRSLRGHWSSSSSSYESSSPSLMSSSS